MKRVFLCLIAAACAHGPERAPPKGNLAEYYPLAVGNKWTYTVELLGSPPETQEISITKEEQGRFADSLNNLLWVDDFGIRDEHRYLLRTPLEVGTRWNNVVSVSSYEQYAIVEAGQSCVAPAGTFHNCVVVESSNRGEGQNVLINTLTFAPKVGIVRMATELAAPDGRRIPQSKLELVAFKVGSGAP